MTYELIVYKTSTGKEPLKDWLDGLESADRMRILKRLDRLRLGNFGDHKSLGDNVYELRFTFGGGFRTYYGISNNKIVILLCGGNKKQQNKDIESAKYFWRDYNENL